MKTIHYNDQNGTYYHRVYHWNSVKFFCNLFTLLFAVGILLISFSTKTKADQTPRSVVVKNGDTLWQIAQSIRPKQDPRLTIECVREANRLKSVTVRPGQKIIVP